MNMKNWHCLFLGTLLLLTGCLYDSDIVLDNSNKLTLDLTLLSSANPTGVTRALSEPQEKNISDIQLLVFDENDKLMSGPIPTSWLTITEPGNITNVSINLPMEEYMNKTVKIMVLGNMTDNNNSSLPTLTVGSTSSEDVINALTYSSTDEWPIDGTRRFPMYGTITTTLSSSSTESSNVWMVRALARVQFKVNDGSGKTITEGPEAGKNLFDMKSVHVYYPRTMGYFCPGTDYLNDNSSVYNIHTLNTFGQLDIDNPLEYTMATDDSEKWRYEKSIYIPEAVNTSTSQQKVVMVLGGVFKEATKTTYYRVEFEKENVPFDILRNWSYDFNIKGVSGPGKDTPEEALVDGMLLTIEVKAWNEIAVAQASVSAYKLEVSESLLAFNNKAKDYTVDVETTYADGWEYDADSKEGNWFTVTPDYTTNKLNLHINANGDNASRYGYFTIHAGDIVKQINLTQLSLQTSNCYIAAESDHDGSFHALQANVMGNGTYGVDIEGTNLVSSMTSLTGATFTDAGGTTKRIYNNDGTIAEDAVKGARIIWQSRPGLITQVGALNPGDPVLTNEGVLKYTVGERLKKSTVPGGVSAATAAGVMFDDESDDELGGNAVIGIFTKDGSEDGDWGQCIWSWHIWVVWDWDTEATDQHFLTNGVRNGFYMQDRNLGAMRNERGDAYSFGLLYEWGRKDPMRSTFNFEKPYSWTPSYPYTGTSVDYDTENGSSQWHLWSGGTAFTDVLVSVQNPMNLSSSWGGGESANTALWGNPAGNVIISGSATSTDATSAAYNGTYVWNEGKKSIYDPCPLGYRVPSVNGFYFGKTGMAMVVHNANGQEAYPYSYCDLDDVGANSQGYIIYYFGQYKKYEKYSTWMPMTPFYEDGALALTSPKDGSEGFAYTWLNCPSGSGNKVKAEMFISKGGGNKGGAGSGMVVGWHPKNYHIHEYGSFGAASNNGGTIRCVRETDPERIPATVPDKIVLLADAGDMMSFDVLTNRGWHVEINNLSYDWFTATKIDDNTVNVTSVTANLTGETREGILFIVLDSGEKYPVRVVQESVSVGGGALTVKCDAESSAYKEITVPAGGSLALPSNHGDDPDFTYTLACTNTTTNTWKFTITSKNANTSPDPITKTFNLQLSDGSNTFDLPVDIKQQEYVISQDPLTLAYTSGNSKSVTFTPPTGSVVSITGGTQDGTVTINSVTYQKYTYQDDWFSYTLVPSGVKVKIDGHETWVIKYTLTATTKQQNLGPDHTETPTITIGNGSGTSNQFPVTVTQLSKASVATCTNKNKQVGALKGTVVGKTDKADNSFLYISNAGGYYYKIEDEPEWVTLSSTITSTNEDGYYQITSDNAVMFIATTEKSFLSTLENETRSGMFEIKLYYYDSVTEEYIDVKTFEDEITQASKQITFTSGTLLGTKGSSWTSNMKLKTVDQDHNYYYEIISSPDWANFDAFKTKTGPIKSNEGVNIAATATASKTSLSARDGIVKVKVYYGTETDGTEFDVTIHQAASSLAFTGGTLGATKNSSGTAITITNGSGLSYEVLSKPEWMNFAASSGNITATPYTLSGTTTEHNVGTSRTGTVTLKIQDGTENLGTIDVTITQSGLGMSVTGATLEKGSGKTNNKALKITKSKNSGPYYYKIVTYPSWISFASLQGTLAYGNENTQISGTTQEQNSTGVIRTEPVVVEIYSDSSYTDLMGTLTGSISQNK